MKNILVPIGTSENAHETLQYAVDFAAQFGSNIYVMEVFSVGPAPSTLANIKEKLEENIREHLMAVIDKVDTKGIDIKMATYKGDIVDGLINIDRELGIDLLIIAPRSNDVREELYLGHTSGKIIKQTDIPTLIVPKGTTFKPPKNILTAFRSGMLKRKEILDPLVAIKDKFDSKIKLLFVKTPSYTKDDLKINIFLLSLGSELTQAESQSTYLGVLQHYGAIDPDMLCVFRRKRGFFKKLWEKNTIAKSEFFVPVPVLVLSVKKD